MATPVLIPVSEYLNRPDRDFVDGELKERNAGEKPHGLLQGMLFSLFGIIAASGVLDDLLAGRL